MTRRRGRESAGRRTGVALLCAMLVLASITALFAAGARDARANGKPIKVVLTYLSGVSNWGPTEATGLAEVVMGEGEVSVGVVGLPTLSDESYAAWIVNTRNSQTISVGTFNPDQYQVARVRVALPAEIPDTGWDLFLVTVEPDGQSAKSPGQRKSIAGYFPDANEAKKAPQQLPKTGGDTDQTLSRANPSYPPARTLVLNSKNILDNGFFTYGVVVLAAFGLGILTRGRINRK